MTAENNSALGFQRLDALSGSIIFHGRIYTPSSIKTALYKFAADFSANVQHEEPDVLNVLIQFESEDLKVQEKLIRALCNEVNDQDLRERIAAETEATRNLILAQAFSKTSLLGKD